MKFVEAKAGEEYRRRSSRQKKCLCHREYNHCIAHNEYGFILEIKPTTDILALTIPEFVLRPTKARTVPTTAAITAKAIEVKKALGFEVLIYHFLRNLKNEIQVSKKPNTERKVINDKERKK